MTILLLLLTLAGCGSKVELYRALQAREANEMLALLMRQGIGVEKTTDNDGTAALIVEAKDVPQAVEVLGAAGLPRDRYADLGSLFKKEGMISSPTEERVRYIYGITQELSRTLSNIDGVLDARVHVVLPEERRDDQKAPPPSAAVLIRYATDTAIDQIVPKIKELVASSLEGVSYDRVAVTLVEASQNTSLLRLTDGAATRATVWEEPPYLVVALGVGMAASFIGNALLAFLMWRRPRQRSGVLATT